MLVPDGSESTLRQPISSVGHRHREDRPDTWSPSVPRQPPIVFTMPPHTTQLLILTHDDAVDPIPSAVQQPSGGFHPDRGFRTPDMAGVGGRCRRGELLICGVSEPIPDPTAI